MDIVLSYPAVERVPNIMVAEKGLRKQGVETRSLATGEREREREAHRIILLTSRLALL